MTKYQASAALALLGIALLLWLSLPRFDNEAVRASSFIARNRTTLAHLIQFAGNHVLPRRIDVEPKLSMQCSNDAECQAGRQLYGVLRDTKIHALVVNEQCSVKPSCSLSMVIERRGLGISGSGLEIMYDTKPDWGNIEIHNVDDAGPNWYYRHLGD